jgi:DNA replication protein DnaC
MERMRIPPRYREAHFDGVSPGPHKLELYNYLVALDDMLARGIGLVLHGKNGTGKTSLAVIALKEARRRGHTGLFVEAAALKDIKFGQKTFEAEMRLWDRILDVDVLVLDDLGKGVRDKEGAEERLLDELLRFRGAYCRTTFITTNMSAIPRRRGELSQLEEYLKTSTIHMLSETSISIAMIGADLREGALDDVVEMIFTGDKYR